MFTSEEDVTQWMLRLAEGDEAAAQVIWERYFDRLALLARQKLSGLPRRIADEEDVALSAMNSFCRAAAAGRYPQLKDRHDLWKLLVTFTAHKVSKQFRRQRAQKRGGGRVRGESAFQKPDQAEKGTGIDNAVSDGPSPELAAMMAETCDELLQRLDEPRLREIALLKMEGYTNSEIAAKMGCTERSIERKVARIRKAWEPPRE